ncbi:hypothetical protein pb186bvf_003360 [Paramecium bursaria]
MFPLHKQSDHSEAVFFTQGCQIQKTQTDKLKLNVRCIISQEILVQKVGHQSEQLLDIKVEYSLYIDMKYLKEIKQLQDCYNAKDQTVELIILCTPGIKIPRSQDIIQFLECFDAINHNKKDFLQIVNGRHEKFLYRLLIISFILKDSRMGDLIVQKLCENLNLFILMKILLIATQYENWPYTDYFYQLMIEYFQFDAGLQQNRIANPHLQSILLKIATSNIQILEPDVIQVNDGQKHLKIATVFFKHLYKKFENRIKKYFQPLQKYIFFKNQRIRSQARIEDDYPHTYKLLDEAAGECHLFAYQQGPHSEILIFDKEVFFKCLIQQQRVQYQKYGEGYLGLIDRNFWGTQFMVYDFGYPKEIAAKFPKYFGQERKLMVTINYQTNIMASAPRKFQAVMLNYITQKNMELSQLEPVYNQEKDCYQLNFFGRAKRASARNFEMVDPQDSNIIYLLHGKQDKNLFNLDYRYPMNMVQAFSFSLVSVSKKFLVQ